MKRILFRADAKPSIGVGDLMSLIHLSEYYIADGWDAHFMIRAYEAGIKLSDQYGLEKKEVISADMTIDREVDYINKYCDKNKIDLVFFEITEHPLSLYKGLHSNINKACVSFDGAILKDMKLVIGWDVNAQNYFKPERYPKTIFLLGPKNVIIPKAFLEDPRILDRTFSNSPQKVLIAMGGADEHNFTQKVAELLLRERPNLYLKIIVGAGYDHFDELVSTTEKYSSQCTIQHNITNMLDQYLSNDIAIAAGGLTASELAASHTPAILIATYEHQIARCQFFDKMGWATYLGFRSFDQNQLLEKIDNVKVPMSWPFYKPRKIVEISNGFNTI